ncbi:MAG: ParB/RepB/Spo0J family partition protein [Sphaerochaetaceae bacterium]|nr:ParB/RepB/Spo0J family partition protein [Spirochaetaceae bacterium]MDY6344752.1 ParB/RepB/Spo0J family partition protein [Sphaerochaetaceae bacterium]
MLLKQTSGRKHGLGKGIESLLDDYSVDSKLLGLSDTVKQPEARQEERVVELPISQIVPNPNQPRKTFDQTTLDELAESVKNQGILQPLLVQKISDTTYSIVAGERRYRAAKQAGLEKIPVLIKQFSDSQRLEVALIENIQRENLNAIEEAKAYAYLIDESGMTQDELAKKVGKNRSTVANSLRLLALSPEMQGDLLAGNINAGQARALLSVVNPADRLKLYEHLKEKELSVRATERLAAAYNEGKRVAFQKKKRKVKDLEDSPEVTVVKEKLFQALGKPVEIKGTIDSGKLVIPYDSADELDQICELLAHEEEE